MIIPLLDSRFYRFLESTGLCGCPSFCHLQILTWRLLKTVKLHRLLVYRVLSPVPGQNLLPGDGAEPNIDKHYPTWNRNDTQNNPELLRRAYKAAWINNVWSMFFMNVTNPANSSDSNSHAFQYLNSVVGKTFPLQYNDTASTPPLDIEPNVLQISTLYGDYLSGTDTGVPGSNSSLFNLSMPGQNFSFPPKPPLYPNPFKVTSTNFSDAGKST